MSSLDSSAAIALLGNNKSLYIKLAQVFLDEASGRIEKLSEASKNKDYEATYETAHAFKNSAMYIGANDLAEMLEQIERCARAEEMSPENALSATKQELTLVQEILEQIVNQPHTL